MAETKMGKRALPPKIAKMKARKRRKLRREEQPHEETNSAANGQAVSLDKLAWQEVALPDKLDDYEGFFGLEEIEGVDVVRDPSNRKVSYRVVEAAKPQRHQPGKSTSDDRPDESDNDEWDGFDDEIERTSPRPNSTADKPKESHAAVEASKRKKAAATPTAANKIDKRSATKRRTEPESTLSTHFEVLEGQDEGDGVDISAWRPLSLSAEINGSLSSLKFEKPTAIQSLAIPHIIAGHDLIGKAPTGSGKTLAFGIPIVEEWLSRRKQQNRAATAASNSPLALIILPTRELALQIDDHLSALRTQSGLDEMKIVTLTGGLSIQKQRRLLVNADIIIGTPGRTWEVVGQGHGVLESLKGIQFLVVDEADRLLTEGHFQELEELLTALDRKVVDESAPESVEEHHSNPRQTLVFSATFSKDLQQKLTKRSRNTSFASSVTKSASMEYLLRKLNFRESKPRFVDVNPESQMATNLQEGMLECPTGTEKDLYLYTLLLLQQQQHPGTTSANPPLRTLVFVNSISAVRRLAPLLQNLRLNALPLHSQMPQKARLRSMERFSSSSNTDKAMSTILVATDVAARGLDIPAVGLVVHYHVPRAADTYIHRSGRTARAERSGASVLICAPDEAQGVRRLVARVHATSKRALRKDEGLRSVELDARVVAKVRRRVVLAKKLADAAGAKERKGKEERWMAEAAEELGFDLDEVDDFGGKDYGRGKGRKKKEEEARGMTKAEMREVRAELTQLLNQKVNVGVSERYLTSGGIDVGALLRKQEENSGFLGKVENLEFD